MGVGRRWGSPYRHGDRIALLPAPELVRVRPGPRLGSGEFRRLSALSLGNSSYEVIPDQHDDSDSGDQQAVLDDVLTVFIAKKSNNWLHAPESPEKVAACGRVGGTATRFTRPMEGFIRRNYLTAQAVRSVVV